MREMTPNDVYRTAFKRVDPKGMVGASYVSNRDKNEMCPYCKNEDTDVIRDVAYLKPFNDFWKDTKYTAVHCPLCEGVWSFNAGDMDEIQKVRQ